MSRSLSEAAASEPETTTVQPNARAIDDLSRLCLDGRENPAVQYEICRPSVDVSSGFCEALESTSDLTGFACWE